MLRYYQSGNGCFAHDFNKLLRRISTFKNTHDQFSCHPQQEPSTIPHAPHSSFPIFQNDFSLVTDVGNSVASLLCSMQIVDLVSTLCPFSCCWHGGKSTLRYQRTFYVPGLAYTCQPCTIGEINIYTSLAATISSFAFEPTTHCRMPAKFTAQARSSLSSGPFLTLSRVFLQQHPSSSSHRLLLDLTHDAAKPALVWGHLSSRLHLAFRPQAV